MLDKFYGELKDYIFNNSNEELEDNYSWYNVEYGDKTDLLNQMYESYLNSYSDEELRMILNDWENKKIKENELRGEI